MASYAEEELLENTEMSIEELAEREITDDQITFMNGEEANLDELGELMFSLKSKPIKRLAIGCKNGPGVIHMDITTLAQAKEYNRRKDVNRTYEECVLLTTFVMEMLCREIGCRVRRTMQELFLYRLPLQFMIRYLGFDRAKFLEVVSLRHCHLSDSGCKIFFKNLSPTIGHIDLTGNIISEKGAVFIGKAIKKQFKINDHNMFGIKRLLLNYNPINSAGLNILIQAILNDFCLKCIELRECNIDNVGESLTLVSVNSELEVFDLRCNPVPDSEDINIITREVLKNNPPQTATYKWSNSERLFMR